MKKIMLPALALMAAHIQASSPVFSNLVSQTTLPLAHANNGQEHLSFNLQWTTTEDACGLILLRFAPRSDAMDEEAVSLALTGNGSAYFLPAGAALSTNILDNLQSSVANGYSVACKIFVSPNKTRVEGNVQGAGIFDTKILDYNDFSPFTFVEIMHLGHGLALTSPVNVRFSPTYTLFLVK